MASKLDSVDKRLMDQVLTLDTFRLEVQSTIATQIMVSRDEAYHKLDSFKAALIGATRGLGGQMDKVELRLVDLAATLQQGPISMEFVPGGSRGDMADALSRRPSPPPMAPSARPEDISALANEVITKIEMRMVDMETKLSGLLAQGDERAIKFSGLGFQSIGQSNAWLETELRNHPSGLIVDIHMVLEHIHRALEGSETIAVMERLYKIKVSCIADSVLAMTSFDTKTPKFFCKVQGHRVLRGDASYLDTIPNHAEWSDVATGFKMRLQEALAKFQEAHGTF